MSDSVNETVSTILWVLTHFGGLLIWPAQACFRRRWDNRSKALAAVCVVHLALVGMLTVLTGAQYGSDAHHAWWLFVVLNLISSAAALVVWLATSRHNDKAISNRV